MTDEEKKAVGKLETLIQYLSVWNENFTIVPADTKYLVPIFNLITKQSKEIEELKAINKMQEYRINEMDIPKSVAEQRERKAYIKGTNDADELCNKKWEDKIKAKTIEIKNRPAKDEFITASQGKLNTIIDMESLLEKE